MFYLGIIEQRLRFGDVLKGYLSTAPTIDKPFVEYVNEPYNIDVNLPNFCVVMDPCCNIGGGSVSLTPLIQIHAHFWDNPYLAKDMTQMNRIMMPKQVMHPQKWNSLSFEDKQELINARPQHNLLNYFVYKEHDMFSPYTVKRELVYEEKIAPDNLPEYEIRKEELEFQTRYYMIDFKSIYHINCRKILKPDKELDETILKSKVLQLSIGTRNELRDKLSFYYGNPPDEDRTDV